MKKITKIKSILITLGIIFVLFILINANFSDYQWKIYENSESINEFKLKRADYLNLTGSPIYINGNDDWALIADTEEWCSGSGTVNDPFVIQKVLIDGERSGYCITITNSDVYFIIKNCIIYNSTYGISLENVKNGKLIGDIHSYSNDNGIHLIQCHNIIITGNRVDNNNHWGIVLGLSNNNIISENLIINNELDGIYFFQTCYNNIISKNKIINNKQQGIDISVSSNENMILRNIVENNEIGIEIWRSNNNYISENSVDGNNWIGIWIASSDSNNITRNNVKNNEDGISLINSKNNNISENIISSNSYFGCFIVEANCTNNLIYRNCFEKNQYNADDSGLNNKWDNGTIGNYWDDYEGEDANDDGIGDTPYYIQTGSQDHFPLMKCPIPMEKDETVIPGYILFILLGMLSVVSIILINKEMKK
ncbi:MAG: nitrous oxide reductase family maturation protein NosD [Candidatus Hodarchaeota archaeon]